MADTDASEQIEKKDEPYNASDPEAVNAARKKSARYKYKRLEVIKALLSQRETRQWLYEIMEWCHVFHTTFVQNQPDSSAFREGERNIGLRLLSDLIEADAEGYIKMLNEGKGQ